MPLKNWRPIWTEETLDWIKKQKHRRSYKMVKGGGPILTAASPIRFSSIVATPTEAPSDPLNEVVITWTTNSVGDSGVEFWTDAEGYAGRHSWYDSSVSSINHSITIDESDGLVAGEIYNFQVYTSGNTSVVGTFTVPAEAVPTVTFDAVAGTFGGDDVNTNITIGSDATGLFVFTLTDSNTAPSAVTLNGVSLGTHEFEYHNFGAYWRLYKMVSPAVGTHAVRVVAAGAAIHFQAISVVNSNLSAPVRDSDGTYDNTWPAELTVTSAVGDLVLHWMELPDLAGDTITATTGGTIRHTLTDGTRRVYLQTRAGAASTKTTGFQKVGSANDYVHLAASIKA